MNIFDYEQKYTMVLCPQTENQWIFFILMMSRKLEIIFNFILTIHTKGVRL
jgi:hypothetical protein